MPKKLFKIARIALLVVPSAVVVLAVVVTGELTIGRDKCQTSERNTTLNTDSAYEQRHANFPIKTIQANGLTFSYIEAGQGPLVLLLHGFPDNARSWEEVMPRLAAEHFHVVAVFNRGYYPTDIPANGDYSVETMGNDVLSLITAFGEKNAYLIGQDWGASLAYAAANIDSEKVRGIVAIAIPHPKLIKPKPVIFRCAPHFLTFQFGALSEWYARHDNFAYLEYLYHYWSPSWSMPADQLKDIKNDFSQPGRLHAALQYYHFALLDNLNTAKTELYNKNVTVPTLLFVGDEDIANRIGMFAEIQDGFNGPFEMLLVPHAGHFLHREQPDIFVQKTIEFLKK